MLLRFPLICLFCCLIGIGRASEATPIDQRTYDEKKITNKFETETHSSDEMLRIIWQKLIDIEERLRNLEENRHPKIDRDIDPVSVFKTEEQKDKGNNGIYKLDKNTEKLNEAGFFILE
ncbi:MAG: hypothetical protein CMK28_01560 [Porticoccaceae bacterium]|nr:hypothetical protein [Porticoccaceae bacterium]